MKRWLPLLLLCWLPLVWAQPQELEIIELRSASVERVLPALRPLLEPGATLSGMNNQLFLRASARNRAEIRQALAAIDKPARQLVIRVANQRGAEDMDRGVAGSGQVVLGTRNQAGIEARVWDSRTVSRDNSSQMVRATEGGPAFIQVGRSLPVPMRQVVIGPGGAVVSETVVYQDIGQGFYAVPQLHGDRVTLEISQQADQPGRQGSIQTQRLNTTLSGRLGEWIELGGTGQQGGRQESGAFALSSRDMREQRSIWLKVEEVR